MKTVAGFVMIVNAAFFLGGVQYKGIAVRWLHEFVCDSLRHVHLPVWA